MKNKDLHEVIKEIKLELKLKPTKFRSAMKEVTNVLKTGCWKQPKTIVWIDWGKNQAKLCKTQCRRQ